jgi:hypothetical protein
VVIYINELNKSNMKAKSNKALYLFLVLLTYIPMVTSAQVGIGTSNPDPSAKLHVDATTQGFLPPRMTTAQRDAIASPADGLIIFNLTTNRLEIKTTISSTTTWLTLMSLTGSETVTNKTLTNPILTNSNDAVVPTAGTIRYNSASGGILQYSNGSSWNTMTSAVQKSLVTGFFTAGVNYADAFYGDLSCTEVIDMNNDFNGNTFTIPRTGNYTFTYTCAANGNAGSLANGTWEVQVVPSGSQTPAVSVYNAPTSLTGFGLNVNGAFTLRLTAGSTVTFKLYNGTGYTQGLRTADFNRFSIIEN